MMSATEQEAQDTRQGTGTVHDLLVVEVGVSSYRTVQCRR